MHAVKPLVLYLARKDGAWLDPVFESLTKAQRAAIAAGLDPERAVFGFSTEGRKMPNPMHAGWLAAVIAKDYLIAKKDLVDGAWYEGKCRHATLAQWDAKQIRPADPFHKETRGVFVYTREKFGEKFPEIINHPEDDDGFDLFWPVRKALTAPSPD